MEVFQAFAATCSIILGMLIFFGVPFGFAAYLRYMRHKEFLTLAEKGLVKQPETKGNGKNALRWGIIIAALGVALCVGMYPIGFITSRTLPGGEVVSFGENFPRYFGPWMLVGLIPTFFGLGLILIYYLTREKQESEEKDEEPAD